MNINSQKMFKHVILLSLLFFILIIGQTSYASERAVVVIEYPSTVEAYVDYSGKIRWEWTTTLKETGGQVGYKVTAEGWIYDREGYRWGPIGGEPITRGPIEVPAGGIKTSTYWCREFCENSVFPGGYAEFTWKGEDTNRNPISVRERVSFTWQPTITATAGTGGKINPSGQIKPGYLSSQAFTITPDPGYEISDVIVDGVSKGPKSSYIFTNIECNHSISVYFTPSGFIITATAEGGGTITPSGSISVKPNASQTFAITPNLGYQISDVKVDGKSVGAVSTYTFTNINSNHNISASFAPISFMITVTAEPGGKIAPNSISVKYGSNQTFTITPDQGYKISNVIVDGKSVGAVSTYTFTNIDSSHSISAYFTILAYTITTTAEKGGTITPSGSVSVNHGSDKTFTITPDLGYELIDVKVDGKSLGAVSSYTFTNVKSDHNISAIFLIKTCTITSIASEGGKIEPAGTVKIEYGKSQTFNIKPDQGYKISDVLVNGVSIGPATQYTFSYAETSLREQTISAKFDKITICKWTLEGRTDIFKSVCDLTTPSLSPVSITTQTTITVCGCADLDQELQAFALYIKITNSASNTCEMVIPPPSDVTINEGNISKNAYAIYISWGVKGIATSIDGEIKKTVNPNDTVELLYLIPKFSTNSTVQIKNIGSFSISPPVVTITSIVSGIGGTIDPLGSIKVNYGSEKTFKIIPDANYIVKDIEVNGKSIGAVTEYKLSNIISDSSIKATFERKQYTITSSVSGTGGSIEPSGQILVDFDSDQIFNIISSNGYVVIDVEIDNISVGAINKYTFTNIKSDHNITAKFGLLGDVNLDGIIKTNDVILILQISIDKIVPNNFQKILADVDGNGEVNSADAIKVLQMIVGIQNSPSYYADPNTEKGIRLAFQGAYVVSDNDLILPINLENTYKLAGGNICIKYDKTALSISEVSSNQDILIESNAYTPGIIRIAFVCLNKLDGNEFFKLKFNILCNTENTVSFGNCKIYSVDLRTLNVDFMNNNILLLTKSPKHSKLLQNFPNPFNPETWIPFQLNKASEVKIKIFDISGNLVRTLELGHRLAGIYTNKNNSAYWDGSNEFGEKMSSGIYFYMIETNNFTDVKKMIIQR